MDMYPRIDEDNGEGPPIFWMLFMSISQKDPKRG
jgi:hypothetical protein